LEVKLITLYTPTWDDARTWRKVSGRAAIVDVRLYRQVGHPFAEAPGAAVQQYKIGVTQCRTVEHGFEQKGIQSGKLEIAAAAPYGIDVEGMKSRKTNVRVLASLA
jgi:hypothetical protein